jgi:spore maturation protein CgeB
LKITFFGLTISSSWGNGHATPYRALFRALARRGHEIAFYEQDVEYYACRRDFTECDFCQLKLYSRWEDIRAQAIGEAAESDAVIVASYCPAGARISDEILALDGPLRVFYDMDTPITLSGLASGDADLDYLRGNQICEFDLYLSFTGGHALAELRQRWGAQRVEPLYGCVDPDVHFRTDYAPIYGCDLSYMGTYAPDRQPLLDELFLEPARQMRSRVFLLAGALYPWQWQWPPNLRRFDHVAPSQHAALYSSSCATLNLTRREMAASGWCPSGRLFEAAACGAPILSDWWEGLDSFFAPQKEILVVRNAAEVMAALRENHGELSRMAVRAAERTFAEHTGEARASEFLKHLDAARSRQVRVPMPQELAA